MLYMFQKRKKIKGTGINRRAVLSIQISLFCVQCITVITLQKPHQTGKHQWLGKLPGSIRMHSM